MELNDLPLFGLIFVLVDMLSKSALMNTSHFVYMRNLPWRNDIRKILYVVDNSDMPL
jgi:hypothetical protein